MGKHTDTPWGATRKGDDDKEGYIIMSPPRIGIHLALTHNGSRSVAKANAEFIVKACNNHAQLVRMLERALPYLQNTPFIHAQVEDTLKQAEVE